ncbi:hypothetical protein HMPREF0548_0146 [Lactobacillus ultunensis DSM 16047]|uniref:Uncharacterized protein n=1 Tax=Lactobacillus ultunensis DSM 16047 TaxID=525365 RepID=C2EKF0_9LACO|nr:hypothetical protein HMPREF0548_0146 [Lactobacillus ultunensis DSM 16047]
MWITGGFCFNSTCNINFLFSYFTNYNYFNISISLTYNHAL